LGVGEKVVVGSKAGDEGAKMWILQILRLGKCS